MNVLLTGANSYIGIHLIPVLLDQGHHVTCLVRDKAHFLKYNSNAGTVDIVEGDLLRGLKPGTLPRDIDAAFYLVSTFSQTSGFAGLEALSAQHFVDSVKITRCKQILTISDIYQEGSELDLSRRHVEQILGDTSVPVTYFKTAMIVGPGSIAAEMFKALTDNDPIVISQNWTQTKSQPIALADVLGYLEGSMLNEQTYGKLFELGGPEVLVFKQMLLTYIAIFKDQKPRLMAVPYVSSQLSSYLLNLLTPISFTMAKSLVESLKFDTVVKDDAISSIISRKRTSFKQALQQLNPVMQ